MTYRYRTAVAALLLGVQACADIPDQISAPDQTVQVSEESDPRADRVARGIALALAEPDIRERLPEDLRDSPFPAHRLHLRSYLHRPRGRPLLEEAARALNLSVATLAGELAGLPDMQMYLPRSLDRVRWTGTGDLVVVGSAEPVERFALRNHLTGLGVTQLLPK